jgi:hypothetical protein
MRSPFCNPKKQRENTRNPRRDAMRPGDAMKFAPSDNEGAGNVLMACQASLWLSNSVSMNTPLASGAVDF